MRKATWLLGVAAALAPAAPAGAQEMKWSEGEALHTQGFNCTSIIFPPARLELQTFSYVSQQVPVDGLPHAGDVFYASVSFGSIGDICGGGGSALPSFVPPAGVDVVLDDPRHPPYWTLFENKQERRGSAEDKVVLLPDATGRRVTAPVRDSSDGQEKPWPYANSGAFISVVVPMRARKRLNGIGTPAPICPQRDNGIACPDDVTGDWLQVENVIADGGAPGTLVPVLGIYAREPRAPRISVGKRPKARRFRVTARTAPGFGLQAFVGRAASRRVTATAKGVATLRLRGQRGRAKLRVVAFADDGSVSAAAKRTLRLR
jgi:hypothetical protein